MKKQLHRYSILAGIALYGLTTYMLIFSLVHVFTPSFSTSYKSNAQVLGISTTNFNCEKATISELQNNDSQLQSLVSASYLRVANAEKVKDVTTVELETKNAENYTSLMKQIDAQMRNCLNK